MIHLFITGRTDIGRVRQTNQDTYICGHLSETAVFAVVCDGMGGVAGGNVASTIAVKIIADRIADGFRDGVSEGFLRNLLESAVTAANVEIYDAAAADPELSGMGTTAVAAICSRGIVYLVHVGDSRAYIIRLAKREMEQVTTDHSIVQAMVEKGELTLSEAKNHPRKHFITRALGVEQQVESDYINFALEDNTLLLLCTDGLTNMVESDDIKTMALTAALDELADRLVASANMNGGSDNITVVILGNTEEGVQKNG